MNGFCWICLRFNLQFSLPTHGWFIKNVLLKSKKALMFTHYRFKLMSALLTKLFLFAIQSLSEQKQTLHCSTAHRQHCWGKKSHFTAAGQLSLFFSFAFIVFLLWLEVKLTSIHVCEMTFLWRAHREHCCPSCQDRCGPSSHGCSLRRPQADHRFLHFCLSLLNVSCPKHMVLFWI